VPGFVTLYVPYILLGRTHSPGHEPLAWLGVLCSVVGTGIYFRCAWEFAVRGLGTPAPIAPTKFLVVSGLHRYVRNPMYIGVLLVILGQAALFHAPQLAAYGALSILLAHLFVLCSLLRGTHVAQAVRGFVLGISSLRAAVDSTAQK
jgi:protein-S-isoprenylcysteine O-methyltransferase Ste14